MNLTTEMCQEDDFVIIENCAGRHARDILVFLFFNELIKFVELIDFDIDNLRKLKPVNIL